MINFDEFIYNYYEKGYVITHLPLEIHKDFWFEIYSTEWTKSKSVFKTVPSWYVEGEQININSHDAQQEFEYHANKKILQQAPQSFKDLAHKVINLPIFDHIKVYKQEPHVSHVHLWNGAEGGYYHQDVIDGSNTLVLIYFTEEQSWQDSYGGRLLLRKTVNNKDVYNDSVNQLSGNMVIINNDNPLFMHKVEELNNSNVNRYTFAFSYNWKKNDS